MSDTFTDTAMATPDDPRPDAGPDTPQKLIGYRSNEEWSALVAGTGALIARLDEIEDAAVREEVFAALEAIDAVHREALHRLVRLFKEGVLEQVVTDPAIETLMGMYGLLPEKTPGCTKVWDFLGEDAPRAEPGVTANPAGEPPHWSPVPLLSPPEEGTATFVRMEEGSFAVVNAGGELHVLDAVCPRHRQLMTGGRLDGFAWICPHAPGCVYDVRNGSRLGGGTPIACRPVRRNANGRVLIGFGMPFEPKLPAF